MEARLERGDLLVAVEAGAGGLRGQGQRVDPGRLLLGGDHLGPQLLETVGAHRALALDALQVGVEVRALALDRRDLVVDRGEPLRLGAEGGRCRGGGQGVVGEAAQVGDVGGLAEVSGDPLPGGGQRDAGALGAGGRRGVLAVPRDDARGAARRVEAGDVGRVLRGATLQRCLLAAGLDDPLPQLGLGSRGLEGLPHRRLLA